jgi:hypothetical protein
MLGVEATSTNHGKAAQMKFSRRSVRQKTHALPALRFEDQRLTSFSGLLLFQVLFSRLRLKERLRGCVASGSAIYDRAQVLLGLVVHLLLGYRELRESRYYRDDPMVQRLLGLRTLPDVATVSRFLSAADPATVGRLRRLLRELVLERLRISRLRRVTLDFDGSVLGTGRRAEGTAVGFNPKKPGQRSYYPLFATVAQCGQVFDVLHRPGNVHDSRGAREFILACIGELRAALPGVAIEVRMDGAFFSDPIVGQLQDLGVAFTLSVPFERFVELKGLIERRRLWHRLGQGVGYFELKWKPKSWSRRLRLVVLRTEHAQRDKQPVQLDLFVPTVRDYRFTVVVTNQRISARKIVRFHHGRGAQEGVFAELKSHGHLGYVPTRTLVGNQIYLLAVLLAHNLARELQMAVSPPQRSTTEQRASLWPFRQLATLRGTLLHRAGSFTRPQGRLTLTISANQALQNELLHYIERLEKAA